MMVYDASASDFENCTILQHPKGLSYDIVQLVNKQPT